MELEQVPPFDRQLILLEVLEGSSTCIVLHLKEFILKFYSVLTESFTKISLEEKEHLFASIESIRVHDSFKPAQYSDDLSSRFFDHKQPVRSAASEKRLKAMLLARIDIRAEFKGGVYQKLALAKWPQVDAVRFVDVALGRRFIPAPGTLTDPAPVRIVF